MYCLSLKQLWDWYGDQLGKCTACYENNFGIGMGISWGNDDDGPQAHMVE